MADQAVAVGLKVVPLVAQHYQKVWDPVQHRYRKMKGRAPRDDPDLQDERTMEEKGYVLKKKSQVASDEEIVETVRHRGEVRPRRPGRPAMGRRRSSMNDARDGNGSRGYGGNGNESEGSVPPRSRTRAKSQGGSRKRGGSSSSASSSDLRSSTDEEKECNKMMRKKWITAALASVATIHAASKVYSSIEAHDKRILDVQTGKISPEEANKAQRAARWQDAAAIGIAALGVKGAMSEWNEVKEEHAEHRELLRKREEHHKKRLEKQRREKARSQGGYYKGRDGDWYYDGPEQQHSERSQSRQLDGPKANERKLIEGPSSRSQARSAYGNDDQTDYRKNDDRRGSSRYAYDDNN